MIYTFIKDKKDGVIYSALDRDVEVEVVKIEAETMEEAFAIADPDYIKRQEEQLEKLKAAYEASIKK
jgi:hypothetical protein